MKKISRLVSLFCIPSIVFASTLFGNTTSEIYISATVASFGGYTLNGVVNAVASTPGRNTIGYIMVDGAANEPYPWIMRIYTDNRDYTQPAGSFYREKLPKGLIKEGGGSLPLLFQTPNTGEAWVYIPDINDETYQSYFAVRDQGPGAKLPDTLTREQVVQGIDPRNAAWVAGQDGILFTDDDNPYGDVTIPTPFKIKLAVDVPKGTPRTKYAPYGKYHTKLILEIISEL